MFIINTVPDPLKCYSCFVLFISKTRNQAIRMNILFELVKPMISNRSRIELENITRKTSPAISTSSRQRWYYHLIYDYIWDLKQNTKKNNLKLLHRSRNDGRQHTRHFNYYKWSSYQYNAIPNARTIECIHLKLSKARRKKPIPAESWKHIQQWRWY